MYRQYEDARELEKKLQEAKEILEEAQKAGEMDDEELYYLFMDVCELEERVNYAWQDEEYDENF
jgi:hypothetical protein